MAVRTHKLRARAGTTDLRTSYTRNVNRRVCTRTRHALDSPDAPPTSITCVPCVYAPPAASLTSIPYIHVRVPLLSFPPISLDTVPLHVRLRRSSQRHPTTRWHSGGTNRTIWTPSFSSSRVSFNAPTALQPPSILPVLCGPKGRCLEFAPRASLLGPHNACSPDIWLYALLTPTSLLPDCVCSLASLA